MMPAERKFDLVILGAGSTAFAAAIRAAEIGKTVAMTESRVVGGTCVNRGCLPSKNLIAGAEAVHAARHPRFDGLGITGVEVDTAALLGGKDALVEQMRHKKYRAIADGTDRIEVIQGRARLEPDGTVSVGELRLVGSAVLVATGARPFIPPIKGLDGIPFLTSDLLSAGEPESMTTLPASLAIVGGGYIACELGQAFARLGTKVILLERSGSLLKGFEPEAGVTIHEVFENEGLDVLLGAEAVSVREGSSGVVVTARHYGSSLDIPAEKLLVAAGRVPNTDDVGLEELGIVKDARGFIRVDEQLRTTREGIWAAGDVVAGAMATPVGAHEGALIADNAFRQAGRRVDRRSVPRAVFTDPPIGTVGLTDHEAKQHGIPCSCRTVKMEHVPRAAAIQKTTGFVKIIAERGTDRVVGVTMVGEGAAEVIHEAAMALRFHATLDDFIDQIHIYPTMAEALKIGALSFRKDITRLSCCAE